MTARSSVKFPENFVFVSGSSAGPAGAKVVVNVRVVSDSYVGMEWVVRGVELDVVDSGKGKGEKG